MPDRKTPRVRIVNDDGRGYMTKVFIDDQDVSECFSAVTIKAGVEGALTAQLDAIAAAVDIRGVEHLRIPNDETRELLIRHGWTPPAEPVEVATENHWASRRRNDPDREQYESLVQELTNRVLDQPVDGRELVEGFMSRVQNEWEPGDDDRLKVERLRDESGEFVPNKRKWTFEVVLDHRGYPDAPAAAPSEPVQEYMDVSGYGNRMLRAMPTAEREPVLPHTPEESA